MKWIGAGAAMTDRSFVQYVAEVIEAEFIKDESTVCLGTAGNKILVWDADDPQFYVIDIRKGKLVTDD